MSKLKHFVKGIAIGATMMVPGVSGGTMALILGIYHDIISAMSNIFKDFKKSFSFLFIVGLGGLVGLGGISWIIDYFIKTYKYPTMFLFLGIVLGGLPVLFKEADQGKKSKFDFVWFLIGIVIIGTLLYFNNVTNESIFTFTNLNPMMLIYLLIAGVVIAVALILPGISTSFLLLTLGLYELTLEAIKTINIPFLLPLVIGTLFGLLVTTKVLENLLNNKPRPTYLMIIGFVVASMFEVFPGIPTDIVTIVISIITLGCGYFLIKYISKKYQN